MLVLGNYIGCRVIVYDKEGQIMADSKVMKHEKPQMSIVIAGQLDVSGGKEHIDLIIFTNAGIHEYEGTVLKVLWTIKATQIGLFSGKVREHRGARRYPINDPGKVEHLIINGQRARLLSPLDVWVSDLSATGILIKGKENYFNLKAVLEVKFYMGGELITVIGRVVRMRGAEPGVVDYGCQLVVA